MPIEQKRMPIAPAVSGLGRTAAALCCSAFFVLLAPVGYAGSGNEDDSAQGESSGQTPYYCYLNGRRMRLWMRADMVASFPQIPAAISRSEYNRRINPEQMRLAAAAKFSDPGPEEVNGGVVGLYSVADDMDAGVAAMFSGGARLYATSPAQKASGDYYRYSEVFSSTPDGADYRALPGGVFVKFEPDWNEARILGWLASHGIESYRAEQVLNNNVYMIQTPQGLEALALANRLHETGEVLYSEPNWWYPVAGR